MFSKQHAYTLPKSKKESGPVKEREREERKKK